MSGSREIICIVCPKGCLMTADENAAGEIRVTGNACAKGPEYALNEIKRPVRTLTSAIRLTSGEMLPVRTDRDIEKGKIFACMRKLNSVKISGPVSMGEILIKNIDGAGADLIASKSSVFNGKSTDK